MHIRRIWSTLPAVGYAALLFWASSNPRLPLPHIGLGFEDKIAHFAAYAILSALVFLALTRPTLLVRKPHLWSVVVALAYAMTDEWHQRHVPGRFFELSDLAADALGIVATQLGIAWYRVRRGKRGVSKAAG